MGTGETKNFISDFGQKLNIGMFELKIWIASYSIIFKVEKKLSKMSKEKLKNRPEFGKGRIKDAIKEEIVEYFRVNAGEKKYKVMKYANAVFEYFGIESKKTGLWLNFLMEENR